jgi:hypothetical protein
MTSEKLSNEYAKTFRKEIYGLLALGVAGASLSIGIAYLVFKDYQAGTMLWSIATVAACLLMFTAALMFFYIAYCYFLDSKKLEVKRVQGKIESRKAMSRNEGFTYTMSVTMPLSDKKYYFTITNKDWNKKLSAMSMNVELVQALHSNKVIKINCLDNGEVLDILVK